MHGVKVLRHGMKACDIDNVHDEGGAASGRHMLTEQPHTRLEQPGLALCNSFSLSLWW